MNPRNPSATRSGYLDPVDLRRDPDLSLAARTDASVLLTGDAEAAARLAYRLHLASGWRHGLFTVVDCASRGTDEAAILDELFPSDRPTPGLVQLRLVQAGTVLLREVHELPLPVQRLVADRLQAFTRSLTCGRSRRRLMASSSRPLIQLVHAGAFDDQLYYRLNTLHFSV